MVWTAAGWGHLAARSSLPTDGGDGSGDPLVIRIYYDEIGDLATLQSFDVWEYNNLQEQYVLAAVDRAGYETLIEQGWTVAIDSEQQQAVNTNLFEGTGFFGGYRTIAEIHDDLATINTAAPSLTEIVTYGQSYCRTAGGCRTPGDDDLPGYPLLALRITNEDTPGSSIIDESTITRGTKPIFFLMANIHAREITTPDIAMRFITHLLDRYNVDADATWLVDHREI